MLSREAENIYWIARYMERAEDTARLINVFGNLLLDLPERQSFVWRELLDITGSLELFSELKQEADEASVIGFLVMDTENPSSILSALKSARENARTIREIIPREAWEQINDQYLDARDGARTALRKGRRYEYLKSVISGVQLLSGLLDGAMMHDAAYQFIQAGTNIERADMTTRIIDIRSTSILSDAPRELAPFENLQWVSVLKSLTAYQMYRQHVGGQVQGAKILDFLIRDPRLPRSITHCLNIVKDSIGKLPSNDEPLKTLDEVSGYVLSETEEELRGLALRDFLDEVQRRLGGLHSSLSKTYFQPS